MNLFCNGQPYAWLDMESGMTWYLPDVKTRSILTDNIADAVWEGEE